MIPPGLMLPPFRPPSALAVGCFFAGACTCFFGFGARCFCLVLFLFLVILCVFCVFFFLNGGLCNLVFGSFSVDVEETF